jgi:hypothetical protein
MTDERLNSTLNVIASILGRCFLLAMGAMLFSWTMTLMAGDFIHRFHSYFVDMTAKEFDIFMLYGFMFMKILNVVLFFIPWAGIRLYLRSQK